MTDGVRYIACGGRGFDDLRLMRRILSIYHPGDQTPVTLVTGGQRKWRPRLRRYVGADYQAEQVAVTLGWIVETYPADWDRYGRSAGPIRNRAMAQAGAVRCIAFPGGSGTAHMVQTALDHRISVARVGHDGRIDVLDPAPSLF